MNFLIRIALVIVVFGIGHLPATAQNGDNDALMKWVRDSYNQIDGIGLAGAMLFETPEGESILAVRDSRDDWRRIEVVRSSNEGSDRTIYFLNGDQPFFVITQSIRYKDGRVGGYAIERRHYVANQTRFRLLEKMAMIDETTVIEEIEERLSKEPNLSLNPAKTPGFDSVESFLATTQKLIQFLEVQTTPAFGAPRN